jgi:hypothetical protein
LSGDIALRAARVLNRTVIIVAYPPASPPSRGRSIMPLFSPIHFFSISSFMPPKDIELSIEYNLLIFKMFQRYSEGEGMASASRDMSRHITDIVREVDNTWAYGRIQEGSSKYRG